MSILSNESSLLKHGKHLPFGIYNGLIDQPYTSFWDTEGPVLARRRRTQRKAWIFFGVYAPGFFAGMAIADAGMVSTAFSYLAIPGENLFVEDKITLPLGFGDKFDPGLRDAWKLGKFSISSEGTQMTCIAKGKIDLEIVAEMQTDSGLSFVCPSEGRPFNFTFKQLPLTILCKARYKGKEYAASGPYGAVDFTKGYPPRETRWNWLSMIGKLEDGVTVGINLVDHFNANMENVAWVGGERMLLGDAKFSMEKPLDTNKWQISTVDGIIDLEFTPFGARSENLSLVVMKSLFTQPYGTFDGYINIRGQKMRVTGQGVVEDHFARW